MLSEDQLLNLDLVLEKVKFLLTESVVLEATEVVARESGYKDMSDREQREFLSRVQKRTQFKNIKDEFTLSLPEGKKLVDTSIKGLLKHPEIQNLYPETLHIFVGRGRSNRLSFSVAEELTYELQCFDPDKEEDIKFEIESWISRTKPTRVYKIWSQVGAAMLTIGGLALGLILLAVLTASNPLINKLDQYQETQLNPQAIKLIEKGIDTSNYLEATEVLLRQRFQYVPKDYKPIDKYSNDSPKLDLLIADLKWILLMSCACLVGYFRPHQLLGVGKNNIRLKNYQLWFKFVLYTIPLALFVTPFWEKLTGWLYS